MSSTYAVLAEFKNPGELMKAAETVRKAGYSKWDVHSPFPIHGMDDAMGLKPSKLGWLVFGHAVLGFTGAVTLLTWASSIAYPINISGKPYANFPAFVPVTFELTVLLSAFGAVFGMFFLNNLPRHHNPLFNSETIRRATDDGFFVVIETADPLYHESKTAELLRNAGASLIEPISA
jgi:hypothetical protein